jgi:hypothetical protein
LYGLSSVIYVTITDIIAITTDCESATISHLGRSTAERGEIRVFLLTGELIV